MNKIIYTNSPESEIWTLLGLFESKLYVETSIKKKIPDISDAELLLRTNEITYSVRQAKEFFVSSNEVSILTSPLLLSYGMLNLGKALVYFKSEKDTDFASYFKKHGANVPINGQARSLSEEYVEIQSFGTFCQISKMYGENSYPNIKLSLKQLLGQVPDLKDIYELIYDESSNVAPLHKIDHGYSLKELGKYYSDYISKINGISDLFQSNGYIIQALQNNIVINRNLSSKNTLKDLKLSFSSASGIDYLRIPLSINDKKIDITDLSIYYLIIFGYGMLARYQAAKWGLYTNPDTSNESEIISKSIRISSFKFLYLIINLFFDEEFEFKNNIDEITKSKRELAEYVYEDIMSKLVNDLRRDIRSGRMRL